MSAFAKKQLLKYGWTEGKGLGKNENGITEAIRPKLKFDTTGIGHKEVDFQWWDFVYDKALKNIVLDKKSDGVSINVAEQDAFNISSTKSSSQIKHQKDFLHHGKFMKTSTLLNGNTIRNSKCVFVEENPEENQFTNKISDEELFKACGGRTGHKGARHGLKLSGKLARVAEQEKQLSSQFLKNDEVGQQQNVKNPKKKKMKKKKPEQSEDDCHKFGNGYPVSDDDSLPSILTQQKEQDCKISKSTRKRIKRKVQDLSYQLNESCMILDDSCQNDQATSHQNESSKVKRKEKKGKRRREELAENGCYDHGEPNPQVKKAKKERENSLIPIVDLESKHYDSGECFIDSPGSESCKYEENKQKRLEKGEFLLGKESDAQWLNNKIKLKSIKKLEKKEKRKIEKLSIDLLAVSLDKHSAGTISKKRCKSKRSKSHKKYENLQNATE